MAFTYDQLMLSFAYAAYFGFDLVGSDRHNANVIQGDLKRALQTWPAFDRSWELAWGPGIFAFPGTLFDDNVTCVFRHKTEPHYVVANRGTNPFSLKSWIIEDFLVGPTTPWPHGNPRRLKPRIACGTAIGLERTQFLRAERGTPGEGTLLLEFLHQAATEHPDARFSLTGHSLGGVLASSVALWLVDEQASGSLPPMTINTTTFAAPTAGNADFAAYSSLRLGTSCRRLNNSLDVAPMVWNSRSMFDLLGLYRSHWVFPSPLLLGAAAALIAGTYFNHYTQIPANAELIPGRFNPLFSNFLAQAVYQHAIGYPEIFGLLHNNAIPLLSIFPGEPTLIQHLEEAVI